MIKNETPLSLAEATEYSQGKESKINLKAFSKKFTKLSAKDGKELRAKLEGLDLMKLDEKSIGKIIDILPENQEDLGKIFIGIGLDDEETKKVLDLVKEYK
ncbi:MAG: hypothetical protein KKB31_02970 [Nanoarchaeota archaeon]|nr:hypothetical protein [Nanoarchaeota archaeon]